MDFILDGELIEQILFAMEDQQHQHLIDSHSGELVRAGEKEDDSDTQYLPIPEWQPIHGFHLMEKFTARLRNPLFRSELKDALSSGRGVFRKFKDILKTNREIERLWFSFKDRELRKIVWHWYNEHRELAGLERLEEEIEETDGLEDLLGSDFSIVAGRADHLESIERLDRDAFAARYPDADPAAVAEHFKSRRANASGPLDKDSRLLVAETPDKDFAGFIWAIEAIDPLGGDRLLEIVQFAVVSYYQGMGLGAMLLKRLIAEARDRGYHKVRSELSGTGLQLDGFFGELGFSQVSQVLELDPSRWNAP